MNGTSKMTSATAREGRSNSNFLDCINHGLTPDAD